MDRWPARVRLARNIVVDDTSGCWTWTGHIKPNGYGEVWVDYRKQLAHRWAYEKLVAPIPAGLTIDHLCRNRACVNPDHMEPVTNVENVMRGMALSAQNARKTHCKRGHPFDEANTYHRPDEPANRQCRTCRAEQLAAFKRKQRAA